MKGKRLFSNYIMMCFIPLVMIPVLIIAVFPYSSTTKEVTSKTKDFYSDVLMQITDNVDLYYNRYDSIFKDIGESKLFQDIINRPQQTAIEQVTYIHDGEEEKGGKGLSNLVSSKTRGSFCLIELNRPDAVKKTSFSIIMAQENDAAFEIEGIQNEPFFLKMKENNDDKPIVAFSYAVDIPVKNRRVMFFRPYRDKNKNEIEAIMLILETQDFLSQLYEGQTGVKLGTLYFMDQFGNVLDKNHPSIKDYYDYDDAKKEYILNLGDDPDDEYEGMSFAEYKMLNTDEKILNSRDVGDCIEKYEHRLMSAPECKIINYEGENFLFIYMKAKDSQIQALYFHPLKQIVRSFHQLIFKIVLIILLVFVAVIIVTRFFCSRFFNEVQHLVDKQKRLLADDSILQQDINNFTLKEIAWLDESFNAMANSVSRTNVVLNDKMKKQAGEIESQNEEIVLFGNAIERETEKSNDVLRNVIPEKILRDILSGSAAAEWFENASIMFCEVSEANPDFSDENSLLMMNELSLIFDDFDLMVERNDCIRIKTMGNVYLAAGGIFKQTSSPALSLVKAAVEFKKYIEQRNRNSEIKLQVKIGISSGSAAGSVIGTGKITYDLFGENVNAAWYLKSFAPDGQIAVSWSTYKLVSGAFKCSKQLPLDIDDYGTLEVYLLENEIV